MRTEVAIVGAGPAGPLPSHLLGLDGIEMVVLKRRSREYVEARVRAGNLESSTVVLLESVGLGEGVSVGGDEHRGSIYLQWPDERHDLDFVDLVGRSVWVYEPTAHTRDLGVARDAARQQFAYEIVETVSHDMDTEHVYVTYVDSSGAEQRIDASVVVGCDGSSGPCRPAIPERVQRTTTGRWARIGWKGRGLDACVCV